MTRPSFIKAVSGPDNAEPLSFTKGASTARAKATLTPEQFLTEVQEMARRIDPKAPGAAQVRAMASLAQPGTDRDFVSDFSRALLEHWRMARPGAPHVRMDAHFVANVVQNSGRLPFFHFDDVSPIDTTMATINFRRHVLTGPSGTTRTWWTNAPLSMERGAPTLFIDPSWTLVDCHLQDPRGAPAWDRLGGFVRDFAPYLRD